MTVIKLIIASATALGNDEVYYWTYALNLQWNYFDHPPFVAWLIRTTTANLHIHNELAVRFGAIMASSCATLIVYKTGKLLLNDRVGWYGVLLYSSSFYCSIIAGTFILPDSPQMIFWLWSIFLLLKITESIEQGIPTLRDWCWFGLAAGLCMMCKIHGAYLWVGVILFALFGNRKLWVQKGMYIAMLISLIIVSPLIIWNIRHHFITYTYHSNRISLFHAGINPLAFARETGGQIFYNNPIVFFLAWMAVFSFIKTKNLIVKRQIQLLLFCALPLIATLIFLSIFRDTLPHWSGPAYCCLIFLSALKLESFSLSKVKAIIGAGILFFLLIVSAGLWAINFYKGTFSSQKDAVKLGMGDPTLDLYGWKETGRIIDSVYRVDQSLEKDKTAQTIVITKWFPAAHLDFYVCNKTGLRTYGIGEIFDLHQYYWSNQSKPKLITGNNAYYIVPSNLYDENSINLIKSQFKSCPAPIILPIFRNGAVCKNILLYKLNGYKK
ncbi:ArnT family glycosyltransferase [Pedobacter sp. KACC 23697]|uniref:Glycosyltransferase family 39 protein n=1 Tax=Pedobacter sp. KACC 23697 TaxID=3149230 RepID=A0AAU7KB53_9SPHI